MRASAIAHRKAASTAAAACAVMLVTACARIPTAPELPPPPAEPGSLGVLDGAYDRTKWRWVANRDGRSLLTHTDLPQCFINPQPDTAFDQGFTVKRESRTIGGTRYEVVSLYEKRDFWEALYLRSGSHTPLLGVYAAGQCQQEAERILQTYEQRGAR